MIDISQDSHWSEKIFKHRSKGFIYFLTAFSYIYFTTNLSRVIKLQGGDLFPFPWCFKYRLKKGKFELCFCLPLVSPLDKIPFVNFTMDSRYIHSLEVLGAVLWSMSYWLDMFFCRDKLQTSLMGKSICSVFALYLIWSFRRRGVVSHYQSNNTSFSCLLLFCRFFHVCRRHCLHICDSEWITNNC